MAFEPNAGLAERTQSDSFGQNCRLVDSEDSAAFLQNRGGSCRIGLSIIANVICPSEHAVVSPRNRIHQGCIVAHHSRVEIELRHNDYLTTMRFQLVIR